MDALELLLNRASLAPRLQGDGAPTDAELEQILTAACRAPDHARLRPWRFIIIRGAARDRLGEVFAEALAARDAEADAEALEAERQRPLRSPLLIAVVAKPKQHPKVPEVEQIVSAGAAATNILTASQALGYGAMMLTGANAYDRQVLAALGLAETEQLIAYVYIGSPDGTPPKMPRPKPEKFTSEWTGTS